MPHVRRLEYTLQTRDDVSFRADVPPIEHTTRDFAFRLADGVATFTFTMPQPNEQTARNLVESFLTQYTTHVNLTALRREVWFDFIRVEWDEIPDKPTVTEHPDGSRTIQLKGAAALTITAGNVTVHTTRGSYPDPPTDFIATPDVLSMWQRYEGYKAGREPAPSMAYFCLTVFEMAARSSDERAARKKAVSYFSIDFPVLATLGWLSTDVGDLSIARKAKLKAQRPHTPAELGWIDEVVPRLIRRAGEVASGARDLPLITLESFSHRLPPRRV